MFQSVRSVTYPVPDLGAARDWYRRLLGREPVFDSPMAAVFAAGETVLVLIPAGNAPASDEGAVVYWSVTDIDAAYKAALDSGATSRSEISISAMRSRIAKIVDPFGNVIGLSSGLETAKSASVEDRPSDSAMSTALCRAMAALDSRAEIRGPDHLAEIFLIPDTRKMLSQPTPREYLIKQFALTGTYQFFIARTAYFDGVVRQALSESIPQIVFLGAGYDSRPYRFRDLIGATRIFELDSLPTQQRKRQLLEKAKVAVPPRVSFVPVNFVRDKLEDVLAKAGYDPAAKTIFVWEGVTYYLPCEGIESTLRFVRANSGPGSEICFDYLLEAPNLMDRHEVKEALASMRAVYQAEPLQFRIPEGSIGTYLAERGYSLVDHVTPEEMEHRYLTRSDGTNADKVLACFAFARASVSAV